MSETDGPDAARDDEARYKTWPTVPTPRAEVRAEASAEAPPRGCLTVIKTTAAGLGHVHTLPEGTVTLGRGSEADIVLRDTGVSRTHARVTRTDKGFVIHDLASMNGLFVNGGQGQDHLLKDGDRIQLGTGTILKFRLQDAAEEEVQRRLYDAATRDPLTGASNRRFLMETLETELAYSRSRRVPLSALLLDLDHFKQINDGYGHPAGDHALKAAAETAQAALRPEDLLARYGGEEFVAVLRHAGREDAVEIAERIRRSLAERELVFEEHRFKVTASIGVATFDPAAHAGAEPLLAAADGALYRAKAEGRNRVVVAGTG